MGGFGFGRAFTFFYRPWILLRVEDALARPPGDLAYQLVGRLSKTADVQSANNPDNPR